MCGYFCIGFVEFMFGGKTLTDFANFFAPNNFKKNDHVIWKYNLTNVQQMVERNSHEKHNIFPSLKDQQKFRL